MSAKRCQHWDVILSEVGEFTEEFVIRGGHLRDRASSDAMPTGAIEATCLKCKHVYHGPAKRRRSSHPCWVIRALEIRERGNIVPDGIERSIPSPSPEAKEERE